MQLSQQSHKNLMKKNLTQSKQSEQSERKTYSHTQIHELT